jgi:hypothetical protein
LCSAWRQAGDWRTEDRHYAGSLACLCGPVWLRGLARWVGFGATVSRAWGLARRAADLAAKFRSTGAVRRALRRQVGCGKPRSSRLSRQCRRLFQRDRGPAIVMEGSGPSTPLKINQSQRNKSGNRSRP